MNKLKMLASLAAMLGLMLTARGEWHWPFDPDSTNKPPRLHRLMEKANDYIEQAEDESLEGNGDKAIENYRLALAELDRVEEENPDRAETPEFAPLRNKRATCTAAIDAIRFAQINENVRAVTLTDTRALERKWRRKHGRQTPEDLEAERKEAAEQRQQNSKVAADTRMEEALKLVRKGDYQAASKLLVALVKDYPDNLNVLLLLAAAQSGDGRHLASRRTLEKAMREHPESYLPCYNLANLSLRLGDDRATAKKYYEKGRKLGGPRNEALEKEFK